MKTPKTPRQRQWAQLVKKEQAFLRQYQKESTGGILEKVEEKVPETLMVTLNSAFSKGFELMFDQGTGVIEKTFSKETLHQEFQVNDFALSLNQGRKTYRRFNKQVTARAHANSAISGIKGVGLGVLGIGLPDIPILVGTLLKGLYEIATQYGYDYTDEQERYFILLLIKTAMTSGAQLPLADGYVNQMALHLRVPETYNQPRFVDAVAQMLSGSLVTVKFIQGIPLVGAIGGAYDAITVNRVLQYGAMKYQRRYFLSHVEKGNTL